MKAILKKLSLLALALFGSYNLNGHGFDGSTFVRLAGHWESIWQIDYQIHEHGREYWIQSKKIGSSGCANSRVKASQEGMTNCYFQISFGPDYSGTIKCTPSQQFYNVNTQAWVPATALQPGDVLLAECDKLETVSRVRFVKEPLKIYSIEVENEHNYFVGAISILTHNSFSVPLEFVGGIEILFDYAAGGLTLGPVGAFGGIIIGGAVVLGSYYFFKKDKNTPFQDSYNIGDIEKNLQKAAEEAARKKAGASAAGGGGGKDPNEGRGWSTTGGIPPQEPDNDSPKNLIGKAFEDWLVRMKGDGARGNFRVDGREFDGALGNIWWEAKSGNYWVEILSRNGALDKFKSDMGSRLNIALKNGANYELHSNSPIPEAIKEWLIKKGIRYFEH